ncbi:MAG TPA: NADH-quinone oxidoreductase subunit L [Candidatus Thermoplasmatota archaeon]|jgi:NADH-quinone oxidoreductase subunit L|nr:NADH-quinone oxidoreductase subunit L [Candidatus Thermoplasmatota archaeon]
MLPLLAQVEGGAAEALAGSAATGVAAWAWLVPFLPALAFVLIAAVGKRTWKGGAGIALAGVGGAMVVGMLVALQVFQTPEAALPLVNTTEWLRVGSLHFDLGFYLDHFTALMLFVVPLLCFLIVLYSTKYMEGDPGIRRYFAEICLFITGMLGLVVAADFLILMIFWEIMGLCSYLLIGYWYEKPEAAAAAKKAFLVTRVGDVFFLLGLVVMGITFGTTNMRELFHMAEQFASAGAGPFAGHTGELTAICLLFFGGAVGKSAQFPLHVWLPDAMEGPTTVSALIHAATMVKAGVYLVARAYPLFVLAPMALTVVAVLGAFTAFFAATMALVSYDIKRVLAYSTVSQLAYMFLGLGVGAIGSAGYAGYTAGIFHLSSHAFTKALLFLGAGSVIHAVHTNDMREMGGLRGHMKWTHLTMLVGALGMAGFPGLAIFWSKDAVLHAAWSAGAYNGLFTVLFALGLLTALMTAFYMFRLYFMTFWGDYRGHGHPHESSPVMTVPLMILAVFAALWGLVFIGGGLGNVVFFEEPEGETFVQAIANPVAAMSIVVGLAGIGLAYLVYAKRSIDPDRAKASLAAPFKLLEQRYYMDHAYNWVAGRAYVALANGVDWLDRNVIDGLVNGIARVQLRSSDRGRRIQSGYVGDYTGAILAGVLVVVMVALYVLNPGSVLHRAFFGPGGG